MGYTGARIGAALRDFGMSLGDALMNLQLRREAEERRERQDEMAERRLGMEEERLDLSRQEAEERARAREVGLRMQERGLREGTLDRARALQEAGYSPTMLPEVTDASLAPGIDTGLSRGDALLQKQFPTGHPFRTPEITDVGPRDITRSSEYEMMQARERTGTKERVRLADEMRRRGLTVTGQPIRRAEDPDKPYDPTFRRMQAIQAAEAVTAIDPGDVRRAARDLAESRGVATTEGAYGRTVDLESPEYQAIYNEVRDAMRLEILRQWGFESEEEHRDIMRAGGGLDYSRNLLRGLGEGRGGGMSMEEWQRILNDLQSRRPGADASEEQLRDWREAMDAHNARRPGG